MFFGSKILATKLSEIVLSPEWPDQVQLIFLWVEIGTISLILCGFITVKMVVSVKFLKKCALVVFCEFDKNDHLLSKTVL